MTPTTSLLAILGLLLLGAFVLYVTTAGSKDLEPPVSQADRLSGVWLRDSANK